MKLQERKEEFERKVTDRKGKVEAEPDLRKLQATFTKKDRELTDLKKKLEVSEGNYKKLREDIVKLTTQYDDLKKDNGKLAEREKVLTAEVNTA